MKCESYNLGGKECLSAISSKKAEPTNPNVTHLNELMKSIRSIKCAETLFWRQVLDLFAFGSD